MSEVMKKEWFAVPLTRIGGWAVATVDKPAYEIEGSNEQVVLEALSEQVARHVAQLHNTWLARRVSLLDYHLHIITGVNEESTTGCNRCAAGLTDGKAYYR